MYKVLNKLKKMKRFYSISVVLIFILVALSACGKGSNKEIETIKQFDVDKGLKIGDVKKTRYLLDLEPNTFDKSGSLSMKVLSDEEALNYENNDFIFHNNPAELIFEDRDNVRLEVPALLTVQLPDDVVLDELFFANYYDGKWEYLMPDYIDLKNKTASVMVTHFSFWGFGQLSESAQIKNFSENFASLQWQQKNIKDNLHKALDRQFEDLFESMGVSDGSIRKRLTLDMIEYLESEIYDPNSELGVYTPISTLANMANALEAGKEGREDYQAVLLEMMGKGIFRAIQRDPAEFSTMAGVTGGLSKAAGAMMEGDTKAALAGISDALRTNFIVRVADDLASFVKESGEYAVELWTKNEIEKAYKIYIGEGTGKYGYDSDLTGKFKEIFEALNGGPRMMEINIVKKYCEKYNIDESTLGDTMRKKIIKNAYDYLENTFIERRAREPEIKALQATQENFILELKKLNMLSESYQKKYFGMDKKGAKYSIGDRLTRLYRIRDLVISFMDEGEAKNISDEFLARLMNQWIYWNEEGNVDEFFKYMKEQGYLKKPFKSDPTYAWVLVDILSEEAPYYKYRTVNLSDGSASYTETHEVSSDVFAVSHSWSKPKDKYKANDVVSLSLSIKITTYDWQDDEYPYFHEGLNNMTSTLGAWFDDPKVNYSGRGYDAIRFRDKDDNVAVSVKTDYGEIIKASESGEFKANFPAGYKEGQRKGIHVVSSPAGKYVYVYEWRKE